MQIRALDYQDGAMSLSGLLVHDDKPVTASVPELSCSPMRAASENTQQTARVGWRCWVL